MARSAHLIAAAREGLDKISTDLENLSGASEQSSPKFKTRRPKLSANKISISGIPGSEKPLSKTQISETPGPKFPAYKTSGTNSSAKPKLPNKEPLGSKASKPGVSPKITLSLEALPPLEPIRPRGSLEPLPPLEPSPPLAANPDRDRSALASYATIEPVDNGKAASSHRRALFRRFLQTRDIEDGRPLERFRRDGIEDAVAEEVGSGKNGKDRDKKGWLRRLRNRKAARAEETRALIPTP